MLGFFDLTLAAKRFRITLEAGAQSLALRVITLGLRDLRVSLELRALQVTPRDDL